MYVSEINCSIFVLFMNYSTNYLSEAEFHTRILILIYMISQITLKEDFFKKADLMIFLMFVCDDYF